MAVISPHVNALAQHADVALLFTRWSAAGWCLAAATMMVMALTAGAVHPNAVTEAPMVYVHATMLTGVSICAGRAGLLHRAVIRAGIEL